MQYRSWLHVPGDSERKLARAAAVGADVVVIDLADLVPHAAKDVARRQAAEWLGIHRQRVTGGPPLGRWVRINPLGSRLWRDDLVAVMPGAPDGIILPDAAGPQAMQHLAAEIYELEQAHQIPSGSTRIMPVASGSAQAAMAIGTYVDASLPRLGGLTWDCGALANAIGATRHKDARGGWTGAFGFVRAQVLLTAHARGLMAVDALPPDVSDDKALKAAARDARADGFTGMQAFHPAHVPIINAAFAASDAELATAREIVSAMDGVDEHGSVQMERGMVGHPHLKVARRTLGLEAGQTPGLQPKRPLLRSA